MKNILNDPTFAEIIKNVDSKHEINLLIGKHLMEHNKNPYDLPKNYQDVIVYAMSAECLTEAELVSNLEKAGFMSVSVSMMSKPENEEDKVAVALCKAMGAPLNKEGMPCMIMHEDSMREFNEHMEKLMRSHSSVFN
jgi:hypothetical protein